MTSSTSINAKNRSLALLSAALLLQAGGSLATARAGDAQSQARELLSQSPASRVIAPANPLPAGGNSLAAANPQEQARRVLLSTGVDGELRNSAARDSTSPSPAAVAQENHGRVRADAQEMARRIVLGAVS